MKAIRNALCAALVLAGATIGTASAEQILVAQYGSGPGGYPYAIALEKGWFKEEGANVTGIVASHGGGTTVRNMLASGAPYGEASAGVVLVANQQGADLIIISDNLPLVSDLMWVTRKDSSIKGLADLKGKRIGYTNPRSVTQAVTLLLLDAAGLKESDVELIPTGGFGEGLAALDRGLVDMVPLGEPLFSNHRDKYRVAVAGRDVLPDVDNVVGVAPRAVAQEKADFIKAVIRARRRAVAMIYDNPAEAAEIIARTHNISVEVARTTIDNLTAAGKPGTPYFSDGQIRLEGIQRQVDLQKRVGALKGDFDIRAIIDTSFLPDDIKAIK